MTRKAALLALTGLCLTACDRGDTGAEGSAEQARAIPEPAFPTVSDTMLQAGPGEDWPTHGGNPANQRFSTLEQVDRGNVHELVPVWIHSTGFHGAFTATPIVVGNTMYVTTGRGEVIALNAATGAELWRFAPPLGTVTLCCGPRNDGVAAYGAKVYLASLDARLYALDARSGEAVWGTTLADPGAGYSATMAPLAVNGRVYVGVAGQHYGIRGFLAAFDAETGEELWRWHTIPGEEQGGWFGEWAETDPFGTPLNRDVPAERGEVATTRRAQGGGGGGIATTPAYDREADRLYINVEGPAPIVSGAMRPGDNLYTGSIVALDAQSGRRVWHAQYLPHDVWGLSGGSPPFLFERGGERYVAFAGRTGWIYVFDADDGSPILRSDNFVPQEALFQHPTLERAVRVAPGSQGGNPGTGVAYDPSRGVAFVGGVHQPMVYRAGSQGYSPGRLWTGGEMRIPPGEERWGTVSAIDLGNGEILWQKRTPAPAQSAALATAGGLVFIGQGAGSIDAFDAETGALLWQFETGAGVHGGPVTYEVAGTQYLVVPSGGSYSFDTAPGDDLITFALASRAASALPSYPDAEFERAGPTRAGGSGVRQLGREEPTPQPTTTPDTTAQERDRPRESGTPAATQPRPQPRESAPEGPSRPVQRPDAGRDTPPSQTTDRADTVTTAPSQRARPVAPVRDAPIGEPAPRRDTVRDTVPSPPAEGSPRGVDSPGRRR